MTFKPFDVSLCNQGFCIACGGTGKVRAKCKAAVLSGMPIDYDEITIPCVSCNGTGSVSTAPRGRRVEK